MGRLRWMGVNIGGYAQPTYDPVAIAEGGFNSVAFVLTRDIDVRAYADRCYRAGLDFCGIIAGGSLNGFADAQEAAAYFTKLYVAPGYVKVLTVLNEADGQRHVHDDGSWILDDDEASGILQAFRSTVKDRYPDFPLFAIGTVTGHPAYFDDADGPGVLDLSGCDGIDNHAYAQWPDTVWGMLSNYDHVDERFGMTQRVIREFGWPHPDPAQRGQYVVSMVQAIEDGNDQRLADGKSIVSGMWVYCWDRDQHSSPFFVNHPSALAAIRTLGYTPSERMWPEPAPAFLGGFKTWHDEAPDLIGEPIENESPPVPGVHFNQQRTTRGLLSWTWARTVNGGHARLLTFYEDATMQRHVRQES